MLSAMTRALCPPFPPQNTKRIPNYPTATVQILSVSLLALAIWIASQPNYAEWLTLLDANEYYYGIYVLIVATIITFAVSILGCAGALMEHHRGLLAYIGTQVLGFVVYTIGAAVLLDFSTLNSSLQPILKRSLTWLISRSAYPTQASVLRLIQESVSVSTYFIFNIMTKVGGNWTN